jgi:hypothetical protein
MSEWEVIWCPICGKEIHRHSTERIKVRARVPSRDTRGASPLLTEMVRDADYEHQRRVKAAEDACVAHYETRHRLRLRLWRRLRWKWLMNRGWPWVKPPDFEPYRFPAR